MIAAQLVTTRAGLQDRFRSNIQVSSLEALGVQVRLNVGHSPVSFSGVEAGDGALVLISFSLNETLTLLVTARVIRAATQAVLDSAGPFNVTVRPGRPDNTRSSLVAGPTTVVAGTLHVAWVILRDSFNNVISSPTPFDSSVPFSVGSQASNAAASTACFSVARGLFEINTTFTLAGASSIAASVDCSGCVSGAIGQQTGILVVPAAPSSTTSSSAGTGLTRGHAGASLFVLVTLGDSSPTSARPVAMARRCVSRTLTPTE